MTFNLDGTEYSYNPDETLFLIQVGKNAKSHYVTKYSREVPSQAVAWYNAINIGLGWKKRLVMRNVQTGATKTLTRATS